MYNPAIGAYLEQIGPRVRGPQGGGCGLETWLAFAALWVVSVPAPPVWAQAEASEQSAAPGPELSEEDRQRAHARFAEGLAHVDALRWSEAEACFREVLAVRWSPVVAYNLASTRAQQGGLIEAMELLRRILREPDVDAEAQLSAQQLLSEVELRVARLTLVPVGEPAGAEVGLDGEVLPAAGLGVPVPVDPGEHEVRSSRAGQELMRTRLTLAEGEERSVEVRLGTPPPSPQEVARRASTASSALAAPAHPPALRAAPEPGPEAPALEDDAVTGSWWFWTGVGVLVVGGAAAAGYVIATRDDGIVEGNFQPGVLKGKGP